MAFRSDQRLTESLLDGSPDIARSIRIREPEGISLSLRTRTDSPRFRWIVDYCYFGAEGHTYFNTDLVTVKTWEMRWEAWAAARTEALTTQVLRIKILRVVE
jgi:hypothetical protein